MPNATPATNVGSNAATLVAAPFQLQDALDLTADTCHDRNRGAGWLQKLSPPQINMLDATLKAKGLDFG